MGHGQPRVTVRYNHSSWSFANDEVVIPRPDAGGSRGVPEPGDLKETARLVEKPDPTNVNTDMLQSEPMYKSFRPDLENPTREDAEPAFYVQQAMPIPYVEPADISNAVLFLASDEARYVTGMQLRVDAAGYLKLYAFHLRVSRVRSDK